MLSTFLSDWNYLSENRYQCCTYWLAVTAFVFSAQLKARNGLCKRLLSKPAFQYKESFMVRVVEADGTTVGESRGTTLWLLQSLARQHWMLNRLGGMGIGEEEMEGTIPVVPCKISGCVTKKAARKTIFTISSGKTSRLNCPGRQALVPQILSPVLTGKLIVERDGE